jgi:hypothetical protein
LKWLAHGVSAERPLWEPWLNWNRAWLTHLQLHFSS